MRSDPLTEASGIQLADVPDDARELLEITARQFLEAGGRISLAEWARLSPESRAALAAAGRQLIAEVAAAIPVAFLASESEEAHEKRVSSALEKVVR